MSFKIDEILPARTFTLEIKCEGYVFPSDRRFKIDVIKGADDYIPHDPLVKLPTENEIKSYIDTKISDPAFTDKLVGPKGQDGIDGRDGSNGLDGRDGRPGSNGSNGSNGIDGNDGQDGKSAYQIWLDLGNVGSEQDFIDSLAPKIERHAPTGYSLDRTTRPWTIHFDNGCDLLMPDYATTETIYGYGYTAYNAETEIEQFPLSEQVMRTSRGHLTIEKWKTSNAACAYWANSTIVINPINDQKLFDFSHAQLNPNDTDKSYSLVRQKNFIRVMYELGIWSEVDIVSLGAVKL
ncbi:hypothetical protein [Lactococcus lactis]|uniref:hypothetical protein n=1 Tax=Lactococcus lactis TaxID=1358 RepID=UPI00241777C9|nr:hypothetical protein [Lactococcus lactis]MDG4970021.1 collagen-like protein [Lactococcus lactis]MDG5103879.1 collagen-like protein [Lactococcus lactis]